MGCRSTGGRTTLIRLVAAPDPHDQDGGSTSVVVDEGKDRAGRGAWLHADAQCFEFAVKRRALGRALRLTGLIDHEAVTQWMGTPIRVRRAQNVLGNRPRNESLTESGFIADEHPMSTQQ